MAKLHSKKLFIKALNKKFGKDFDLAGRQLAGNPGFTVLASRAAPLYSTRLV